MKDIADMSDEELKKMIRRLNEERHMRQNFNRSKNRQSNRVWDANIMPKKSYEVIYTQKIIINY